MIEKKLMMLALGAFLIVGISVAANAQGISVDGFQNVALTANAQGIERQVAIKLSNTSAAPISGLQIRIVSLTPAAEVLQGNLTVPDLQANQQAVSSVGTIRTDGTAANYIIEIRYTDSNGNAVAEKHPFSM